MRTRISVTCVPSEVLIVPMVIRVDGYKSMISMSTLRNSGPRGDQRLISAYACLSSEHTAFIAQLASLKAHQLYLSPHSIMQCIHILDS